VLGQVVLGHADECVHSGSVLRQEQRGDRPGGARHRGALLFAPETVLLDDATGHFDPAHPVPAVDHDHATRADHDVIDHRLRGPRPLHAGQHHPAVLFEGLERSQHDLGVQGVGTGPMPRSILATPQIVPGRPLDGCRPATTGWQQACGDTARQRVHSVGGSHARSFVQHAW
jgi:hypothetical protein